MGRMSIDEMADFLGRDELRVKNLLKSFQRNSERAGMVRRALARLCRKAGIDPDDPSKFLPPRAGRLSPKGILIGAAKGLARAVRIPLRLLQRVVLICGSPGKGKSTLVFSIICQLILEGKKVLVFDFSGEHRSLCRLFGPDKLLAISYKDIQANPWEAQGDPEEHIQNMCDISWESFFFRDGATYELSELLREMYREEGVFSGGKDFPTQGDFERKLDELLAGPKAKPGSRRSKWIESLTRLKGIFAYLKGFRAKTSAGLHKLFEKSVIVDVSDLSGVPLDFFCLYLIKFLEGQRMGRFPDEVELVIVIDEAHHLLSYIKERRMSLQEPLLVKSIRGLRKRGIAIIPVDHSPADLPGALLSCVELTISFGLGGPQSVRAVQYLMGISDEKGRYLAELDVREAVVQSGEFGPAFQIEVPEIVIPPPPSEQEVRSRMEPVLNNIFPPKVKPPSTPKAKAPTISKPTVPAWFTIEVRRVLESIATHPHYYVEERANELGMPPSVESAARGTLVNYGLVDKGGQYANRRQLFILTAKGQDWCTALRIPVHRFKSGIEHEACLRATIKSILAVSPRIACTKPFAVGQVQPDGMLKFPGGGRLAIQVCCSKNHAREADRLLRLRGAGGIDTIVLCGKDKSHSDAVRRAVEKVHSGRIPKQFIFVTAEECVLNKIDWKTKLAHLHV